jgi:hypothetical protein
MLPGHRIENRLRDCARRQIGYLVGMPRSIGSTRMSSRARKTAARSLACGRVSRSPRPRADDKIVR